MTLLILSTKESRVMDSDAFCREVALPKWIKLDIITLDTLLKNGFLTV